MRLLLLPTTVLTYHLPQPFATVMRIQQKRWPFATNRVPSIKTAAPSKYPTHYIRHGEVFAKKRIKFFFCFSDGSDEDKRTEGKIK